MHWVREIFSMACLSHWGPNIIALPTCWSLDAVSLRSNSSHTIDCCVSTRNWLFVRTTMVDSITLIIVVIVLDWWRCIHAHDIAEIWHVWGTNGSRCSLSASYHWIVSIVIVCRTLVWAAGVAWVIRVARWDSTMVVLRHVLRVI